MPGIEYPEKLEIDYQKRIKKRLARASAAVEEAYSEFRSIHGPSIEKNSLRNDSLSREQLIKKIKDYIGAARGGFLRARDEAKLRELGVQFANRMDKFNQEQLYSKFKDELQLSALPKLIGAAKFSGWVSDNVSGIKDLEEEFFDGVLDAVENGIRAGDRPESIGSRISDITGRSQKKSELMARNQFGNLNAQVNEKRQSELGIRRYRWRDSGDDRVRDLHQTLDDKTFSWKEGGHSSEGHPGEPYNCRCTSDAIIEDAIRNDGFLNRVEIKPSNEQIYIAEMEI